MGNGRDSSWVVSGRAPGQLFLVGSGYASGASIDCDWSSERSEHPSIRELGYLVIHALVMTIPVELHELFPGDLEAPPFAGEMRPGGALSPFETARGLHILDLGEIQQCGKLGQESS